MENSFDFVGLGFCSNDYLCILPYIPLDNKVSAIGDDADGKKMIEDFEAEKVCTKGIKVRKGCESPLAYCWIDEPTGARSVAWSPQARAASLGPAAIRPNSKPTKLICRFWTALKFYISTDTTPKAPSPR